MVSKCFIEAFDPFIMIKISPTFEQAQQSNDGNSHGFSILLPFLDLDWLPMESCNVNNYIAFSEAWVENSKYHR